ncbi:MAG: molybdopterin-binding protein [Rhodobacteraceae bacterium]|nr:molybdopterin-binding protein [Paracoccaceae bacterium]
MKFGPVDVDAAPDAALGAILAHSLKLDSGRLRKGVILTKDHLEHIRQAGIGQVTVARLDPDDIHENDAAVRLAQALVPDPKGAGLRLSTAFTGRVNILATGPGVAVLDVAALERFNGIHPMITIATVPPFQQMAAGGMVATIKIIAYGVPGQDVAQAAEAARSSVRQAGVVFDTVGLVVSNIAGGPANDKGISAISNRVRALGMELAETREVAHDAGALSEAIQQIKGDMVLILTGSATSDPNDVAPSALRRAGGQVERFGMPVDPGNLLFLGHLHERPVIGLPGCARSPALNGADWVLARVACGITVTGDDIAGMGVGGLLKEIPTRPQPRAGART